MQLIMDNTYNEQIGKNNQSALPELEKSKSHIIVEILEYVPNSVVNRTIIRKSTGNVTVTSFDTGEELAEKTLPFDTYVQIIAGNAEVIINEKKFQIKDVYKRQILFCSK